jgi:Fe-S oxidoreductase, related to NifB/MoaA family
MPLARVVAVAPGSPAHGAGVQVGDELVDVNGEELRDVIRYQVQVDEPNVALTLRRGESTRQVQIDKAAGAPLGVELDSAVFDRVRTCDNHCPFCFIYQLPKGMRKSLYLKDDDYRLSFLYGNFTTLTRFTEADLERVITEGLGPLYVSIHATDPDVRTALLRNRRGATSLRWLGMLLDAGVEVHGQIVVCPGVNDAAVLDDTLLGILDRFPRLASVGAVPLGVSNFTTEADMRPHTRAEAETVLDIIDAWQTRFLAAVGHRMVFAADEYYLMADRPFPNADAYEGFEQHENGIGMARTFQQEVANAAAGESVTGVGSRSGFFAWVDGAPATGYRAPRTSALNVVDARSADRTDAPVVILTGEYGARVLEPMVPTLTKLSGVAVSIMPVANSFFGGNIAVTGLLTGADITGALAGVPADARILLPDVVLSEDRFLDGLTLADLPRAVEVIGTDGASLVGALDRRHALVGVAS